MLLDPRPRPLARPRARPVALGALACAAALSGCYSDGYLDGLCVNTGPCPEPPPESPVAFRITALELVDPHTYKMDVGVCTDTTMALNALIAGEIANFDVNTTLVFRPLDPGSAVTKLQIVPAFCIAGDPTNCTDRDRETLSLSTDAFNKPAGSCGGTEPNSLNPDYDPPNKPPAPCFDSPRLPAMGLWLAADAGTPQLLFNLVEVRVSSTYQIDDPPQRLITGSLTGFMTSGSAMLPAGVIDMQEYVLWNELAGAAGCQVDMNNMFTDIDNAAVYGQGVWMYFNFTAERVQWATDMPEPTPGTTGDPTTTDPTTTTTSPATTGTPMTTGATTL